MQDAMERHYHKLRGMEQQKQVEKQDFQWRVQADQELI
jgi:hypothetical protein